MSELKLRLPLSWPNRENGALLPAICSGALVLGMGVQLLAPPAPDLPLSVGKHRATLNVLPPITVGSGAMRIVGPSLFAPTRVVATADSEQAVAMGPLDGAYVTGAVRVGAQNRIFLQDENRRLMKLAPGQTYRGWRLLEIRADSARFRKDGKAVTVNFGLSPASALGDLSTNEDNQ